MRRHLLPLWLILLPAFPVLLAQNPMPLDLPIARQLIAEAVVLCDSGKFEQAEFRAESAYDYLVLTPEENQGDLAEAAFQTGRAAFNLEKYGGARPFFIKAAEIWSTAYPEGALITADALYYASLCSHYRNKFSDALQFGTEAYQIRQKLLPAQHRDRAESLRSLGNLYLELSRYSKAIECYEAALHIEEINYGKESLRVADVLTNLGSAQLHQGYYEQSLSTTEKALLIRKRLLPAIHRDIAMSYDNLGDYYDALHQYALALNYFEKSIDIRRQITGDSIFEMAGIYSKIGQCCLNKGDLAKARYYFEAENRVMINTNSTAEASYAYTCLDMGRLFSALKDYPAAIAWKEKMLVLYKSAYSDLNSNMGGAYSNLAASRLANGDFEIALELFRKADQIYESIYGADDPMATRADGGLANAYRHWYLSTGTDSLLDKSRQHYRLAEKGILAQLRKETSKTVQEKFLAEAKVTLEKSIGTELLYFNKQQQPEALQNAWQLSESMHSFMLFSASQEAAARHFAEIPEEDLLKDSLLQAATIALRKKRQYLLAYFGMALTDSLVLDLNAQIFSKKEASKQLRGYFEKKFPDYYRLKFDLSTLSLQETQQLLEPQQTLLEYFTGDSSIFIFVVHKDNSQVVEVPRDFPLTDWIIALQQGISGFQTSHERTDALYEQTVRQYADYAQKLYEKLLAPVAGLLSPDLLIIPSEELAALPFDALLSSPPKNLSNFNTYPFAARQYMMSYAYSATMLQQMQARKHRHTPQKRLLAFAPFFEGDINSIAQRHTQDESVPLGLTPLPYSGEEVRRVSSHLSAKSDVLLNKAATKQQFQQMAGQYQVLHLATHGKANHKAGEFSFLAFAAEQGDSLYGLLSAAELYNCSLNADMVVLSACETGIGETLRGEGVVSLASAFGFAGAKSIVASLWKVNDKATMEIMDNFYAELASGAAKNTALSKAKLQYLKKHPGQDAHPFFWAGFEAIGDMSPIRN